jgi:hypothetical protein
MGKLRADEPGHAARMAAWHQQLSRCAPTSHKPRVIDNPADPAHIATMSARSTKTPLI